MKALRGFTIFEMLVVMVISSIAIALSTLIWMNLEKYFQKALVESRTRTEIMLLKEQLRQDLSSTEKLLYIIDGFRLITSTQDITYSAFDEFLVRESTLSEDTFKVKSLEIKSIPVKKNADLLHEASMQILTEGVEISLKVVINYDSKTLLNFIRE